MAVNRTSGGPATRPDSACRWLDSGMGSVLLYAPVAQVGFFRRGRLRSSSRPSSSALFDADDPAWSAVSATKG